MALTTGWLPEPDSDEHREAARRAGLEAAYRREHAGYVQQGKTERAAAVEVAARSELGIEIGATPTRARKASTGR